MRKIQFRALGFAALCGVVAGTASAGVGDVTVNGVNIFNDFGEFGSDWVMSNATDQSGLSATYTSGVTDFDSYVASTTVSDAAAGQTWFGNGSHPTPGNIDFDLGSDLTVSELAMWSFGAGAGSDVNVLDGFDVFVDDNPGFSSPTFAGSFTFVNDVNTGAAQVFDLADADGRYVRLTLTDQNTSLVGMGEFVFGARAVPAPGAIALLGVAGLFARRRRRA